MNAAPPALESLPDQVMATIMRLLIPASLAIVAFVTIMAVNSDDANAVVCARGVYRAGCVSAGGAAGVGVRSSARVAPRSFDAVPHQDKAGGCGH
jgi:hypothetical protein